LKTITITNSEISIKLADTGLVAHALDAYTFGRNTNFLPIPFSIRDESNNKTVLLIAELQSEVGFRVVNYNRKEKEEIMIVTLGAKDGPYCGKVQHPAGATLYTVVDLLFIDL
jgi:hypothetical protein